MTGMRTSAPTAKPSALYRQDWIDPRSGLIYIVYWYWAIFRPAKACTDAILAINCNSRELLVNLCLIPCIKTRPFERGSSRWVQTLL